MSGTSYAAFQSTNAGGLDAFVTKLNSSGTGLIYSTYLGGSSNDTAYGLALDTSNNIYIVGDTASTAATFPETASAYQTVKSGGTDAFVGKLNPGTAGSGSLTYLTYFGGSGTDHGYAIAVNSGYAYITGQTGSSSSFPLASANDSTLGGLQDAFVAKINPASGGSSDLIFSTYLGGSGRETGWGIAADSSYCYVAGEESSTIGTSGSSNFIVTSGAYQSTNAGGSDIFVATFSSTGTFTYANTRGGSGNDRGLAVAMNSGKIVVTGETDSSGLQTTNATQLNSQGGTDAFVAEFDPSQSGNNSLPFFTYQAGTQTDSGRGIAVSGSTAYVTGFTDSLSDIGGFGTFPATSSAYLTDNQGGYDAFAVKITSLP